MDFEHCDTFLSTPQLFPNLQSASTSLFHRFPTFPPKFQTLPSTTRLLQFHIPRMAFLSGFRVWSQIGQGGSFSSSSSSSSSSLGDNGFCSFIEYAGKRGLNVEDDLVILLYHVQIACNQIASLMASPFNYSLGKWSSLGSAAGGGSDRDAPKPLDTVSLQFDKTVASQIKIAEGSLEKDLLAMVTEDSKILLHRFNWQRLWTISQASCIRCCTRFGRPVTLHIKLTVYNYKGGPCYRCLFPTPPPTTACQRYADSGVLG